LKTKDERSVATKVQSGNQSRLHNYQHYVRKF